MEHSFHRRLISFLTGVFFSALGISMITKAGLGTSPIASLALVLSHLTGLSLGTMTFLSNSLMFVGECFLEDKGFFKRQWLQLPATFVFSVIIDLTAWVISGIPLPHYIFQLLMLFGGTFSLGCGVGLQVLGALLLLPGEGFVFSLSKKLQKPFRKVKTLFDFGLVASAAFISFLAIQSIYGIREGTVIAAVCVGSISHWCRKRVELFLFGLQKDS